MDRNAQMEILGLAIIVVLVMLGVLFAIRFVLLGESPDVLGEFRESELASNMLTTMMSTTSACRQASVRNLVQDCGLGERIDCGIRNSCEEAKYTITQMLEQSLEKWNREYVFVIADSSEDTRMNINNSVCIGEREFASEPIVITPGTTWTASLFLCR